MSKCPNCGYSLERCDNCCLPATIAVSWSDRGPIFYCDVHITGIWRWYFDDHSYDQIDLQAQWIDGQWHMFLEHDSGWKRDGTCEHIRFIAPNKLERCGVPDATVFEDAVGRSVVCTSHNFSIRE